MNQTFIDYLKDTHAEQADEVLDDDMPDDFERWLENQQIDEVISWADLYGRLQFNAGQTSVLNEMKEIPQFEGTLESLDKLIIK